MDRGMTSEVFQPEHKIVYTTFGVEIIFYYQLRLTYLFQM